LGECIAVEIPPRYNMDDQDEGCDVSHHDEANVGVVNEGETDD